MRYLGWIHHDSWPIVSPRKVRRLSDCVRQSAGTRRIIVTLRDITYLYVTMDWVLRVIKRLCNGYIFLGVFRQTEKRGREC